MLVDALYLYSNELSLHPNKPLCRASPHVIASGPMDLLSSLLDTIMCHNNVYFYATHNRIILSPVTGSFSLDVMRQYLPKDAKCLELFARNLLPGWTSWGNEVLFNIQLLLYPSNCIVTS